MTQPTVAILGASRDRTKFGNKAVRAHQAAGFSVYPVNPQADEVEGLPCYPSLQEVPLDKLDRVSVYLPPARLLPLLDEIAAVASGEVWLNPGTESAEVLRRADDLGLNVIQACSIVGVGISPADL